MLEIAVSLGLVGPLNGQEFRSEVSMPPKHDPSEFWDRGYATIANLMNARQLAFARAAIGLSERSGRMVHRTGIVPQGALNEYSAPVALLMLRQCLPAVEASVGKELLPTYAFWRIYGHGAQLNRHFDREACEVSATITIDAEPHSAAWPIWFRDLSGNESSLALPAGSAALYQGMRVEHWREPYGGQRQCQIFLHYVVADGPYAAQAGDQVRMKAANHEILADVWQNLDFTGQ